LKQIRKRLTYANVMSSIAVFLVLGGATALAAGLAKNSVGSKQLKKNAVTAAKIKKNAVTTAKIQNGAVTGAKLNVGSLPTVPSAATAGSANTANSAKTAESAGNAGNANTVGGQSVVKLFKTLTEGQVDVTVASVGGFTVIASCGSDDADVRITSPSGPGWVMEAGGVPGSDSAETTEDYESGSPGETDDIDVDEYSEAAGDATYGISSFYGATSTGTVVDGVIGYDYNTFSDTPPDTCIVAGHLTVG
jgi:hypothetical protein